MVITKIASNVGVYIFSNSSQQLRRRTFQSWIIIPSHHQPTSITIRQSRSYANDTDSKDHDTKSTSSSSSSSSSSKSQQQPENVKKTPSTPVRILETARNAAKVRPRVMPGSSSTTILKTTVGQQQQQQQTQPQQTQHPAHHFMDGGMPCDPALPRYSLADYGEESLYTLILLRHGESEWNSLNQYTGWCDVDLTDIGRQEARDAGRLLYENNIEIDQAFTSVLKRASFSCNMALNTANQHWVPVTKTWRLNERHYGALQGYNKDTAYMELGLDQELVMQMRRAYATRPPIMQDDHPYWHGNDRRYRKLTHEQLEASRAESLKDAAARILPFFNSVITPSIQSGKKCLIVSHANTIRTLVKHIDNISDEDIKGMTIPTGIPLLYRLDKNMKPVDPLVELEFRYMVEPKG
jgi:2,3-bisphosphoglycerate-dependent phosphoglycerate mutase